MDKRYIAVYAKNKIESSEYQKALFNKGFEWINSGAIVQEKHSNFYARFDDMKIITCYHDPSIDDESIKLSIAEIESYELI